MIASCRFLGISDVVTAYFIGVLTLSFSIVIARWLKKELEVEKLPKYTTVVIFIILSVITLWSMKSIGMWV